MTHLYLFQIGPVQSFIAAARRTQDLYIGSRILSELARSGITAAATLSGFKPIFPMRNAQGQFPSSVPHRFAFISNEQPDRTVKAVQTAIQHRWMNEIAGKVKEWLKRKIGGGSWEPLFDHQVESWLEFNWVAVEYAEAEHQSCFQTASRALAARRQSRQIRQVDEPGVKCTVTGSQAALPIDWNRLREAIGDQSDQKIIRPGERLGALALIKRFAGSAFANCALGEKETFPSTEDISGAARGGLKGKDVRGYLAVLHMDGDSMGKRLSELKTLESHQNFSQKLAEFADEHVREIFARSEYKGAALVYAGGDDVLALLPLGIALDVADELRRTFYELTNCSASAGIAVTPDDLPLDMALEMARKAEEDAKDNLGRNAVVITEAHGTGQTRSAGGQWERKIAPNGKQEVQLQTVELMTEIQQEFAVQTLSAKLAYDVQQIAYELVPTKDAAKSAPNAHWAAMRKTEFERLAKRRVTPGKTLAKDLIENLTAFAEAEGERGWERLANWLILMRFLAQHSARPEVTR
jgi:CRISPR-associated protein Cmr2